MKKRRPGKKRKPPGGGDPVSILFNRGGNILGTSNQKENLGKKGEREKPSEEEN